MSFLVTGGTGLIGHYILREIIDKKGGEIIVYDLYPNMALVEDIADRITIVQGNVLDRSKLFDLVEEYEPEYIVHGAAFRYDACSKNPTECIKVNCIGTNNIFDAAIQAKTKRVVYMSSQNIYGTADTYYWKKHPVIVDENDPSTSLQPYGVTKWVNEAMAHIYYVRYGLDSLGFRITGVWGHGRYGGEGTVGHMNAFVRDVGLGRTARVPPQLYGSKHLTWVYGKNAAKWLVQSCFIENPFRRVYCMGTNPPFAFDDIIVVLRSLFPNACITPAEESTEWAEGPKKMGKLEGYVDCTRMYDELGFKPHLDMKEAIRDFVNFHRKEAGMTLV